MVGRWVEEQRLLKISSYRVRKEKQSGGANGHQCHMLRSWMRTAKWPVEFADDLSDLVLTNFLRLRDKGKGTSDRFITKLSMTSHFSLVVVQLLSCVKLCKAMDCSTRGLSFPISWSFPKFMKITLYQTTFPDLWYGKMQLLQHNTRCNEAVGYLSRSWWWAGKPGVLQSMGSQRVDTTERLNWTELRIFSKPLLFLGPQFPHLEKDRRRDRVVFSQTQNSIFCHPRCSWSMLVLMGMLNQDSGVVKEKPPTPL